MSDSFIFISVLILGSLGGWYFLLSKYYALKAELELEQQSKADQLKSKHDPATQVSSKTSLDRYSASRFDPSMLDGNHIQGMGLPPTIPFSMPDSLVDSIRNNSPAATSDRVQVSNKTILTKNKQQICNLTAIIHLSGLIFLLGVPLLGAVVPAVLWLYWRDRHNFLNKHGILVVNWQLNLAVLQLISLMLGMVFIITFPTLSTKILEATKTMRLVFSSGIYLPFNLFSAPIAIYGCIVSIRGAIAGYRGISMKFPELYKFVPMVANTVQDEPTIAPPLINEPVPPNIPPRGFGFS